MIRLSFQGIWAFSAQKPFISEPTAEQPVKKCYQSLRFTLLPILLVHTYEASFCGFRKDRIASAAVLLREASFG
jgi:hypothetical protein